MTFSRALWTCALEAKATRKKRHTYYLPMAVDKLIARSSLKPITVYDDIFQGMREKSLSGGRFENHEAINRSALQPITFLRQLLRDVRPDHDLRYFAMRNIRSQFSCEYSIDFADCFQVLSRTVNRLIEARRQKHDTSQREQRALGFGFANILDELRHGLETMNRPLSSNATILEAFLESCRMVNYVQLHDKVDFLRVTTDHLDSAFLLSNLFGLPTGIVGFDELFGGGGIMLADNGRHGNSTQGGGRAILAIGRYGAGKSVLSLQFALEVARKGGLAYVLSVEQPPERYLRGFTSISALPPADLVDVAVTPAERDSVISRGPDGRGAVIIVTPPRDSFDDFIFTLQKDLSSISDGYPTKLLVIDPVNAIVRTRTDPYELRRDTREMLDEMKASGYNVWLAAEEIHSSGSELQHEQNVADTVIKLSVEKIYGYTQRYFEIAKSRDQREQRGKHAFSITPNQGVRIFPSAAAVRARIRPRTIRTPEDPVTFGLPSLDEVLGEGAIAAGDVIVLQGSSGTFKTLLGLHFLLGMDLPRGGYATNQRAQSLLVGGLDNADTIRHVSTHIFPTDRSHSAKRRKSGTDIRTCPINGGYVEPGFILQQVEEHFLQARLAGESIDRMMVDNLSHWEMTCPFVQAESTFGDTLVEFARRHQVTSLFVCSDNLQASQGVLQRSIIDNANCVIQFRRIDFRGAYKIILRVVKTRSMRHRRESFELLVDGSDVRVDTRSSLLRVTSGGDVESVKIRLFLHHESSMQNQYHTDWVDRLQSVLSSNIDIDPHDSSAFLQGMKWASTSSIDELQICQVDEFQLPLIRDNERMASLHVFKDREWRKDWEGLFERLKKRCKTPKGSFFAVPLFENVSLLANRREYVDCDGRQIATDVSSWDALADQCDEWNRGDRDPKSMFFDFAGTTDENYNCLFLEILLTLSRPILAHGACSLIAWLMSDDAVKACILYRRLCRRAHLVKSRSPIADGTRGKTEDRSVHLSDNAIVWRLWYSSANQLLAGMAPNDREGIQIGSLPGEVTIAGEWYLAMPAYSSSHEIGLQIIETLTDRQAELARLRRGVGLPTRSEFYEQMASDEIEPTPVSPYFSMKIALLSRLINSAFVRSSFHCYSEISSILAAHLKMVIEIPEMSSDAIEFKTRVIIKNLAGLLRFARPSFDCRLCEATDILRGIKVEGQREG